MLFNIFLIPHSFQIIVNITYSGGSTTSKIGIKSGKKPPNIGFLRLFATLFMEFYIKI